MFLKIKIFACEYFEFVYLKVTSFYAYLTEFLINYSDNLYLDSIFLIHFIA